MRVLLIYPRSPDAFWSFKHSLPFVAKKAAFQPLGLLTVAAMMPSEWEMKLLDLNVERLRDEEPTALRATAIRCRAAYGVKDSVRDVLPESLTEPFLDALDRLIREIDRARA